MTKAIFFLLASLLFCSGISDVQMEMSQHFDHPNPVKEVEFSYHDKAMENKQFIVCDVCKKILRKVIEWIGKTASKKEINDKIERICQKTRIPGCNTFVQKYKNKIVNALVSGNKADSICIKLSLCKQMDM